MIRSVLFSLLLACGGNIDHAPQETETPATPCTADAAPPVELRCTIADDGGQTPRWLSCGVDSFVCFHGGYANRCDEGPCVVGDRCVWEAHAGSLEGTVTP